MKEEGKNWQTKGSLPKAGTPRRAVRLFAWKGGTGVPPGISKVPGSTPASGVPPRATRGGQKNHFGRRPVESGARAHPTAPEGGRGPRDESPAAPRKWDAGGEASLPILFEGRYRTVGTFGVYSPFSFHSHSFDSHLFGGDVMNTFSIAADSCGYSIGGQSGGIQNFYGGGGVFAAEMAGQPLGGDLIF